MNMNSVMSTVMSTVCSSLILMHLVLLTLIGSGNFIAPTRLNLGFCDYADDGRGSD
jgi:hypothetical protein